MKKNKHFSSLLIILYGALIGICDLIPGFSGGTIAFICGIYERFISSLGNISTKNIITIFKLIGKFDFKKFNKLFIKNDFYFLLKLSFGMFFSIYIFANFLKNLFDNHYVYLMSFFIGLILISSFDIYKHLKKHNLVNLSIFFKGMTFLILF